MPIKSYRLLYKITQMSRAVDDNPSGVDPGAGGTPAQTTKPLYCLMKKSIGDFLGLVPLEWNAPELTGTFKVSTATGETVAGNEGTKYRKRLGGFRVASYTLVAITQFDITEYVKNQATGAITTSQKKYRTISIGFPTGHSVNEFVNFIVSTGKASQISGIRTPAGRLIPVSTGGTTASP
jgi:hypothetical protein